MLLGASAPVELRRRGRPRRHALAGERAARWRRQAPEDIRVLSERAATAKQASDDVGALYAVLSLVGEPFIRTAAHRVAARDRVAGPGGPVAADLRRRAAHGHRPRAERAARRVAREPRGRAAAGAARGTCGSASRRCCAPTRGWPRRGTPDGWRTRRTISATLAYRAGASTNIEVLDAARQARDADTATAQAEDLSRQARLDLLVSAGRFP